MIDENDGQMIFGDLGGLKLPEICLTGEENLRKKNLTQETFSTGDRTRARCVTGAHATAWTTAVDNMFGENVRIVRENAEIFMKASMDTGLEINPKKTKFIITYRQQNVVENQNIIIGNLSFKNVEKFKYLGVTVTNTNDSRQEIIRRINMGVACHYSLQKILSWLL